MSAPAPKEIPQLTPAIVAYSNGPVLLAQTTPAFTIAALVMLLRCYTRARILKSFGTDDWVMIVALVAATICHVCYAIQIHLSVGKYVAVIQADADCYRHILMIRQIHMTAVVAGLSLVKISICFFLLRLATRRPYVWFLWALLGFLGAFTVACMGTLIFQCVPVEAAWDVRLRPPPMGTGDATCLADATFHDIGTFNGVVHIVTDFLLALIPVPLIWKLHMPLRTRISLVIVLSLGIFAATAGIKRQLSTADFLAPEPWIRDTYGVWNFIELYVGMIAASLPAIKPLFNWFFNAVGSISKGTKTSRFSSRVEEGQQRRVQPWDTEGFVL